MRGRSRNKGPNPLTRSYESNGPDVKVRGTAQHVADKYAQLARDAQASGDPVMAENYFQHAEHYYRIIAAAQEQLRQQFGFQGRPYDDEGEEGDDEFDRSGVERLEDLDPSMQPQPSFDGRGGRDFPRSDYPRGDRNERGDRGEGRDRGDRRDFRDRGERQDRGQQERGQQERGEGRDRGDRGDRGDSRRERFQRDRRDDGRRDDVRREAPARDEAPQPEFSGSPEQPRLEPREEAPRRERPRRERRSPEPRAEREADEAPAGLPAFVMKPTPMPAAAVEGAPKPGGDEEEAPKPRRRTTRKKAAEPTSEGGSDEAAE